MWVTAPEAQGLRDVYMGLYFDSMNFHYCLCIPRKCPPFEVKGGLHYLPIDSPDRLTDAERHMISICQLEKGAVHARQISFLRWLKGFIFWNA